MPNRTMSRAAIAGALAAGIVASTAGASSAATSYVSPGYNSTASCLAAQRAWQSSWTKVTKPCYKHLVTSGTISLDYYDYRFEGVTQ